MKAQFGLLYEYLPPAYVVRREGNSFTLFVCPHLGGGGVPISHNALQHFPECHGAVGGGGPGTPPPPPPGGGYLIGYPPGGSGYPPWGYLTRYPPGGVRVPPPRGYLTGYPPPPRGGTQVGQQKEYSLHGGRYASCVHAG